MDASISVRLSDQDVHRIAKAVVELLPNAAPDGWFNVKTAAEYCAMSEEAIRGAEKRGQLAAHRTATGRLSFRRDDLDAFMGAGGRRGGPDPGMDVPF